MRLASAKPVHVVRLASAGETEYFNIGRTSGNLKRSQLVTYSQVNHVLVDFLSFWQNIWSACPQKNVHQV